MGWYKRGLRRYYFRSKRGDDGKVKKEYFGSGPVADIAASADALKRREMQEMRQRWSEDKALIEAACEAFFELDSGCDLVRDATLLSAGFHRPSRHKWRTWIYGRIILRQEA